MPVKLAGDETKRRSSNESANRERAGSESGEPKQLAALVLCGGQSRRMGSPKAFLRLGNRSLLEMVVDAVASVVHCVHVVAAQNQRIPMLPKVQCVTRDPMPYEGPYGAIVWGLESLPSSIHGVFVASCDAPLLQPAVVREMLNRLGDCDIAIPRIAGRLHPLCAAYRRTLATAARARFENGERRPVNLLEGHNVCFVEEAEFRAIDPEFHSLRNANTPQEFRALESLLNADA